MDVVVYNKVEVESAKILAAIRAIPSGGGADLSALEVYIADFLADPPAVTEGALNAFHRTLVS